MRAPGEFGVKYNDIVYSTPDVEKIYKFDENENTIV